MSTRIRFLNITSSTMDGAIFVGAFLIGAFWIAVTRLGFNTGAVFALLGPLAALGTYAVLLLVGRFQLREDRAADNLYYLGFLFTLVSLGIGLYRYNNDLSGVENIIKDLGVGLTTTIVGLFLRILFLQLRVDADEAGEDAKVELSRAIESFRADVLQIAEVSRTSQAILQQQYSEAGEHLSSFASELSTNITDLSKSIKGFDKKISSIDVPADVFTSRFDNASSTLERSVKDLAQRIGASEFNLAPIVNQISGSSGKIVQQLDSLSTQLSNLKIDQSTLLKDVDAGVNRVVADMVRASTAIEPLLDSITATARSYQANSEVIQSVTGKLEILAGSESVVLQAVNQLAEIVSRFNDVSVRIGQLPDLVSNSVSGMGKFGASLQVSSGALDQGMKDAVVDIQQIRNSAAGLAKSINEITTEFTVAIAALVKAANTQQGAS